MLIYHNTKQGFIQDVKAEQLVGFVKESYTAKIGKVNKSELRSWENSLIYMYMALDDANIPEDAGVAIEFNIPNTSKRVDFIISGKDDKGKSNLVIVELKQW
ncbi:MAG TPA: ATP-binding protein, partial [Epulopiscium sp.]|nr:ATP-binding protein [Candidatus Epulonipiscium sp.]